MLASAKRMVSLAVSNVLRAIWKSTDYWSCELQNITWLRWMVILLYNVRVFMYAVCHGKHNSFWIADFICGRTVYYSMYSMSDSIFCLCYSLAAEGHTKLPNIRCCMQWQFVCTSWHTGGQSDHPVRIHTGQSEGKIDRVCLWIVSIQLSVYFDL